MKAPTVLGPKIEPRKPSLCPLALTGRFHKMTVCVYGCVYVCQRASERAREKERELPVRIVNNTLLVLFPYQSLKLEPHYLTSLTSLLGQKLDPPESRSTKNYFQPRVQVHTHTHTESGHHPNVWGEAIVSNISNSTSNFVKDFPL